MKRLVIVFGTLCFASSALALPMPFSFPPPWHGEFLGFQLVRQIADRDGIKGQCEDENGRWELPQDRGQRADGMLVCLRPSIERQIITVFSFDNSGLVWAAATVTSGDLALFEAWEHQSEVELGQPQISNRNMRAWSTTDENGRPWYRLLTFSPETSRIAYAHVQSNVPHRLLYGSDQVNK